MRLWLHAKLRTAARDVHALLALPDAPVRIHAHGTDASPPDGPPTDDDAPGVRPDLHQSPLPTHALGLQRLSTSPQAS